ncbi:alpha/beta hydrolase domain-containing protein [Humitalea sp. 24SJ18S-53]|uniref:alpha/beta hydrolase domain-containing protein n=1 Tax=Humitalea sp. 24SJ18S-53 TaxID=3422307 RepID=UPI003D66B92E
MLRVAAVVLLLSTPAMAHVVRFEETSRTAFPANFGAGAYVVIQGVAHGELDPADPRNAVIADLAIAPRNAAGRVEYRSEVTLLRPADPARFNGRLVHEVTNRGRKFLFAYLYDASLPNQAALNALATEESVGLGRPLAEGAAMVWNGWDPDVPQGGGNLRLQVPVLAGLTATIRDEFVFGTRLPATATTAPLSYPLAPPAALRLTMRWTRAQAPVDVAFEVAGPQAIRLPGGGRFEAGAIYEATYAARDPRPLGIGFAATRDIASWLRHGGAPMADLPVRGVLGVGISQAGRYLRHHIDLGMNADEAGRRVFDGVLAHISGAGRVFINERFAQPNRTATWHEDFAFPEHWFPLARGAGRDPATDPLVLEVNTSTEYWQKGAGLTHTTPDATADLPEVAGARHYLVAGTKHGGRAGQGVAPGNCANPNNPHSAGPLLRALLVALDAWVTEGRAPPPSRVPRLADGTLVPAETVLGGFPPIAHLPPGVTPIAPVIDWVAGTRPDVGWRPLVPAVDADGNERAGVLLPDIAVPLGTYTGWNLYRAENIAREPCDREGSFMPFARTDAARAPGDPRPSVAARWPTQAAFIAATRAAGADLVRDRLLLEEDAAAYVRGAEALGAVWRP